MSQDVILRELSGVTELQRAEAFQVEVWGEGEKPDNSDILMALQSEGALVAGAFRGGEMLGFLLGFPTVTSGLQHSHRLAVHARARVVGLGARLKWFQRDWCLARGITKVRWTYDPLRAINAGLNMGVLGAVADEYFVDYYGEMPGINAGLPSDRLMAVWHLDSEWVVARAQGAAPDSLGGPTSVLKSRKTSMRLSQRIPQRRCRSVCACAQPCKRPFPRAVRLLALIGRGIAICWGRSDPSKYLNRRSGRPRGTRGAAIVQH